MLSFRSSQSYCNQGSTFMGKDGKVGFYHIIFICMQYANSSFLLVHHLSIMCYTIISQLDARMHLSLIQKNAFCSQNHDQSLWLIVIYFSKHLFTGVLSLIYLQLADDVIFSYTLPSILVIVFCLSFISHCSLFFAYQGLALQRFKRNMLAFPPRTVTEK